MRVANKLTLALLPCAGLALGVIGWVSVQRERAHFEHDARSEERRWGRCAAAFLEQVWIDEGPEGARRLLERSSPLLEQLHMRWVWIDRESPDPENRPLAPAEALKPLFAGEVVAFNLPTPEGGAERVVTYVPLRNAEGSLVALELEESLSEQRAFVRRSALLVVGSAVGMTGLFLLASLIAGRRLVGRPSQALLNLARGVGSGDLSQRLELRGSDEFAELAVEMNRMCDHLLEARARVAEESARRVEALERLRHADRLATLGRIAAGVAHELGTPLNVAQGYADMVARDETLEPQALRELGAKIGRVCRRMAETIRVTLDFARRRGADKRPLDLRRLVANVQELTAQVARRRGIEVAFADGPAERLEVDGGQLEQALTNLVVNAIQATPAGGRVQLELAREHRARPHEDGSEGSPLEVVCVSVRDQGPGISPEHIERLYELFFTTREPGEGTGLGLPLALEVVEGHGGWIEVESELGQGSSFEVCLPWSPCPEQAQRPDGED
ncbi:MAG: HAMP domain-containing histidine kinase [Planctomycetes bacterium]|nr:HAMP domain-containing histidine kinase [Planctomycetota bacterium]